MKLLVSACLLGVGCRYDGKSNQIPRLAELMKKHTCIPVCAELFGGLPTPRVPAERRGNKVINRDGEDVTDAFVRGTAEVLRLADLYGCKAALLKERSPSCGSGQIYDGTFTKTLVEGDGLTAQLLKKKGTDHLWRVPNWGAAGRAPLLLQHLKPSPALRGDAAPPATGQAARGKNASLP